MTPIERLKTHSIMDLNLMPHEIELARAIKKLLAAYEIAIKIIDNAASITVDAGDYAKWNDAKKELEG